jgi:PEP-CTERM motif
MARYLFALFLVFSSTSVFAAPIEFDFRSTDLSALEGANFLSLTSGALTLTVVANQGVLNQTAGGFGINSPGSGDAADQLDGASGVESLTFTLNLPVSLISFAVSSFGPADIGEYVLPGAAAVPFNTTGTHLLNSLLAAGEAFSVVYVEGNGFSFDKLTVETAAPVPLPAALPLFAGGLGLMGWLARRRRKRRQPLTHNLTNEGVP